MLDSVATFDVEDTRRQRLLFAKVRNAERYYGVQLRKVAKHIDDLVRGIDLTNHNDVDMLRRMLERYSEVLRPWARSAAARMLSEVSRRDLAAWRAHAKLLGTELRREIAEAPTGDIIQRLMDNQVDLITSLPRDAAQRVHNIVVGNLYTGARPDEVAKHIMETGNVTKARANLIAYTESSRAATALTQARSEQMGVTHYVWRSVMDYKTRPELGIRGFSRLNTLARGSHRKLNGTVHAWNNPPVAAPDGTRAHPGSIFYCRCYAEPVLSQL